MRILPLLPGLLLTSALIAQPVDRAITRCSTIPVGSSTSEFELERCAEDVEVNTIWQVDRSDSVNGELNGFAMRRTTGRGAVVYVVDSGVMQRHDEFQRPGGDNVLGGFDAVRASGLPSCDDYALEPCGFLAVVGHGTAVASAVAGLHSGVAPDASLYSVGVFPTLPGNAEIWMWHVALNEIIRHAWDPATPSFETAVVTISIPATPLPNNPLYVTLVDKVRRMTKGVDVNANEDPSGKKFLFTAAAGNVNPRVDFCRTFPSVLGVEIDGVVSVGGITRENKWWSGSCAGELVEIVAPAESPVLASIFGESRYRTGPGTSGTSYAAPYVAGIAARLLEIDPSRTPAELEALLKASPSRAADSGLAVPVLTIGMEMRNEK